MASPSNQAAVLSSEAKRGRAPSRNPGSPCRPALPGCTKAGAREQPPEGIIGRRKPRALAVLAVDDDRLSLMQTSAMLNNLGHKVFTATSGETALDMLRREDTVDVVILDHSMPGITGTELAEVIRMEWPTIAVIFHLVAWISWADVVGRVA